MKRISIALVVTVFLFVSLLFDIVKDFGKSMPGYTVDGWMIVEFIVYFLTIFLLGFYVHNDFKNKKNK